VPADFPEDISEYPYIFAQNFSGDTYAVMYCNDIFYMQPASRTIQIPRPTKAVRYVYNFVSNRWDFSRNTVNGVSQNYYAWNGNISLTNANTVAWTSYTMHKADNSVWREYQAPYPIYRYK
jgi:hypothetical protein